MKTKIYTISYTSYDEVDNFLYNDTRTTDGRIDAIALYESWRNNARENAQGGDEGYPIKQVEISLTEQSRKYQVSREVGTGNGYQAIVRLSVTEI